MGIVIYGESKQLNTDAATVLAVAEFLGFCLVLGFVRFDGESTLPGTAANESRWAAPRPLKPILAKRCIKNAGT